MVTLDEARRENQRLRNQLEAKRESEAIGRERNRLLKENAILLRRQKFPKTARFADSFARGFVGGTKNLGKNLLTIATKIDNAEKRSQALGRKTGKIPVKRKTTRRTIKKKKR